MQCSAISNAKKKFNLKKWLNKWFPCVKLIAVIFEQYVFAYRR